MLKPASFFIASILSGSFLLMSASAQAATVAYDFTGTIDFGALNGETLSGNLSYDDAALSVSGFVQLALSSLSISFHSATFDATDADSAPTVDFQDGVFLGLGYSNSVFDPTFSFLSGINDVSEASFAYTPVVGTAGYGSLAYTLSAIPVPSAAWLMACASLGLLALSRRQTA